MNIPYRIVCLFLMSMAVSGCVTSMLSDQSPNFDVTQISLVEKEDGISLQPIEIARGGPQPRSLMGIDDTAGIVNAPQLRTLSKNILKELLGNMPRYKARAENIDVFISSHQGFGGFATAEGDIIISAASFQNPREGTESGKYTIRSEDELAFLLAHEASHILLNHFETQDELSDRQRFLEAMKSIAQIAGFVSRLDTHRVGNQVQVTADFKAMEIVQEIAVAVEVINIVLEGALLPGWTREQEDAADRLAIDILARSGKYNSHHAFKAYEKLQSDEERRSEEVNNRLDDMREKLLFLQIGNSSNLGEAAWRSVVVIAGTTLTSIMLDHMSPLHRDWDERQKNAKLYANSLWGEAAPGFVDPAPPHTDRLQYALDARQSKSLFAVHRSVQEVFDNLDGENGSLSEAYSHGRHAITGIGSSDPAARLAMYQLRRRQGEDGLALRNLEIAARGAHPAPAVLRKLAEEYAVRGERLNAMRTLSRIEQQYGEDESVYIRASVVSRLGELDEAQRLLDACKNGPKPFVRQQCIAERHELDSLRQSQSIDPTTLGSGDRSPGTRDPSNGGGFFQSFKDMVDEFKKP